MNRKAKWTAWTPQEDSLLLKLVDKHGRKWRRVALTYNHKSTKHRTEDSIRNRWNRINIDLFCYEMSDSIDTPNDENIDDNGMSAEENGYDYLMDITYNDLISALELDQYGTNNAK
tara:strand:+ start:726 stop:1073 length:348 start_codon:yes stop_codon:yes gene_type:complete